MWVFVRYFNILFRAIIIKQSATSTYLEEFRTRPVLERRALSIHLHKDGEEGPSFSDVVNATLSALSSIFHHSKAPQLSLIMRASCKNISELEKWQELSHCCWFAERSSEWSQYQYRHAIPSLLVEQLMDMQDAATPTPAHFALASMIKTVFNSPVPLVNLPTSDVISKFIALVLRRVAIDEKDGLLALLAECISSLGAHVYYSDQIHDLAGELINRINIVEVHGISFRSNDVDDRSRSQGIRCLLAGLHGLMQASNKHEARQATLQTSQNEDKPPLQSATTSQSWAEASKVLARSASRSRISPELWQETLDILCDNDFAVRADYAVLLLDYISEELQKDDTPGIDGAPPRVGVEQNKALLRYSDSTLKMLNAMHAYLYVLATSASLGLSIGSHPPAVSSLQPPVETSSPDIPNVNILPATPLTETPTSGQPSADGPQLQTPEYGRRSISVTPTSQKGTIVQRLMEHAPSYISPEALATESDYSFIATLLVAVQEQLPLHAILAGVPMILALDGATTFKGSTDTEYLYRVRVVKETLAKAWEAIARAWKCTELAEIVNKVRSSCRLSLTGHLLTRI
jgi:protein EFR3